MISSETQLLSNYICGKKTNLRVSFTDIPSLKAEVGFSYNITKTVHLRSVQENCLFLTTTESSLDLTQTYLSL